MILNLYIHIIIITIIFIKSIIIFEIKYYPDEVNFLFFDI